MPDGSYGLTRTEAAMAEYICATNNNVVSDTTYALRDKSGKRFPLSNQKGSLPYGVESFSRSETCTPTEKAVISIKRYLIGDTDQLLAWETTTTYRVKLKSMPSL